jgi:hypothetical protein
MSLLSRVTNESDGDLGGLEFAVETEDEDLMSEGTKSFAKILLSPSFILGGGRVSDEGFSKEGGLVAGVALLIEATALTGRGEDV